MVIPASIICFAAIIAYAITQQKLLYDVQLLFAPAIKTPKYRFHQKMKALIHNIHAHDFDYKQLVGMLHETLKCAVGLNIDGRPVAACGGDETFLRFRLEELNQEILDLQAAGRNRQEELHLLSQATFQNFEAIHAHLESCGIEAILPIYDQEQILGTLQFGRGFSEKIYSKQDFQLITALWTQLVVALKYIRKLEEQVALKDRLIEKLSRKIQLQDTHARVLKSRQDFIPAEAGHVAFISKKDDLELPLPDWKRYASPAAADEDRSADIYILDGRTGISTFGLQLKDLNKPVIVIGSYRDLADDLLESRWIDVITPGRMAEELRPTMQFLLNLPQAVRFQVNGNDFISVAPKLLTMLAHLEQTAKAAKTILITGETGTGKELIASYIGKICQKKMISVNCAAINGGLFETAFCGHEKGAFTGADQCHRGYLEQADKAILFLDEISELPLELQAKLLRIIEGAPFQRMGGRHFIQPDVQLICATNRSLKRLVKAGKFREDLLYRLDQLSLALPPLNQRREDIPVLGRYFWMRFKRQFRIDASVSAAMVEQLKTRTWQGNVRELANTVLKWATDAKTESAAAAHANGPSLPEKLKLFEATLIHDSLKRHSSKSKAASALGIPFSTLRSKLKRIDICTDAGPEIPHPAALDDGLSLTEKLNLYEASIICESLKHSDTQSEAARVLGIPLSTLRSKLKKHNIGAR